MQYDWDENKREANLIKHGIDFDSVCDFEWATAFTEADERDQYGERRFVSFGYIRIRLHVLVFTYRKNSTRVISLRKANKREMAYYEKEARPYFPERVGRR